MVEYCKNCQNLYELTPNGNIPIQQCPVCGFSTDLKPNTLLFTKIKPKGHLDHDPLNLGLIEQKIHSPVIMKTKNYTCPNKDCLTHKHPEMKSASFERFNYQSYRVYYICDVCKTRWY